MLFRSCFKKNILYEIKCLDCEDVDKEASYCYVGESSRSIFCRSREHLIGYEKGITGNPLFKHSIDKHDGSKKLNFQIKVVKQFFTALSRMVAESVRIARMSETNGNFLLNSKGEYNRCKLPRLTIDGGGGWSEGKNSFLNPALNVGPDVVTRESKVCQRTLKPEISTVSRYPPTCTLSQTGSQSEIKYFPLFNSSPAQQMINVLIALVTVFFLEQSRAETVINN